MKPNSIVQFERLYLASIAVWLLQSLLQFESNVATATAQTGQAGLGGLVIAMTLAILAVAIGIWYLVVRRRSAIGKWILSIWFLIQTCLIALAIFAAGLSFQLGILLNLLGYGLGTWALSYLFKPDAEEWLGKKPSA
jgi:hypothetical protein